MLKGWSTPEALRDSFGAFIMSRVSRQAGGQRRVHICVWTVVAGISVATIVALPQSADGQKPDLHAYVSNDGTAVSVVESTSPEHEPPFNPLLPDDQQIIFGSRNELKKVLAPAAFPYRALVLIKAGLNSCSGWLYGKNVVATAGHCVSDEKGNWFTKLTVVATAAPQRSCNAKTLFSTVGWTTGGGWEYQLRRY